MASKQDKSVIGTIFDDFLTCKICCHIYNDPKILPCIHTYCLLCIQKLLQTSTTPGSIFCPECRQSVAVPQGTASDLKTNVFMNGLIEILKVKSSEDIKCTICHLRGKTSPAKSRCLDCGDYLCSSCSDGHNASSATWNHKKVLLEDIKGGSYDMELRYLHRLTCSEHHDKILEYFCETCQMPICMVCILVKHRNHKSVTTIEAVTVRKSRLNTNSETIRENLKGLKIEERKALENISNIEKMEASIKEDIDKQVARVIAKTEQQKQKALQIVDGIIVNKTHTYKSQLDGIQLKLSIRNNCLEFCEKITEQGKDEEILLLEDIVVSRLKELEDTPATECTLDDTVLLTINIEEMCGMHNSQTLTDDSLRANKETLMQTEKTKKRISLNLERSFKVRDLFPVTGMTVVDKMILLSDKANSKIIQISTTGNIGHTIYTNDVCPCAIAGCVNTIGVIDSNKLYIFSTTGTEISNILLAPERPTQCHTVANFNNKGYIVGRQERDDFRVYDTSGRRQETISVSVAYPLANISVDQFGNITTCEWGDNSVRVLSPHDGDTIVCTEIPSLRANAACVDRNGFIYTVEAVGNRLSVFDQNGYCMLHRITTQDGLDNPVNLAFDDEGLMYVVSQRGCITVYRVHIE
ncbi:E3 ubiquitin-protein ligase TRIM56-like [Gigantopelta aegis]|uniref:E3 ubiquitin-protein ligase TRIM56-like n=1 Tax=Gigantopelta aegis TaxID=1735272 RepID=UPI001B88BDFC|nr:E3 ubiquitin-protein ligase TRIM56-like [Gigantopelta aegis]